MIQEGKKAPAFKLSDKDGTMISLREIDTPFTVVYFYPKDSTPGCTIEANEFNEMRSRFEKAGATIIGISGGTNKTKEKFCTKYKLKFPLLSDEDFSVAKSYDAYGKKKFMGREYMGIFRKTYLLDKNKKIVKIFEDVSPKGHAEEVLACIRSIDE